MNIRLLIAGGALAVVASMPVLAHPVTYTGILSELTEVTHLNPLSLGTGTVTVIFDDDNFTMDVSTSFSGLTGTTTASHIHCCTPVSEVGTAGVATPVPSFPGFPLGVKSGNYSQLFDMTQASSWNAAFITANGGTVASAFSAFATGLSTGRAYLNIHTSAVGGGEIRAFLTPAPVPVPASVGLLASGLVAFGRVLRRQRTA